MEEEALIEKLLVKKHYCRQEATMQETPKNNSIFCFEKDFHWIKYTKQSDKNIDSKIIFGI